MKTLVDEKEVEKAVKAVDIKTFIKMQKSLNVLKKTLMSKKGFLYFKALVRNPLSYDKFLKYLKKKKYKLIKETLTII